MMNNLYEVIPSVIYKFVIEKVLSTVFHTMDSRQHKSVVSNTRGKLR
jgi:hypothetical protein